MCSRRMRQVSLPGCLQVGGLRDTVQQFSPYDNTGTGWTFEWADGGNFRCGPTFAESCILP